MNWFKLISVLLSVGSTAADIFVKNEQSKKTKDALVHLAGTVVEGLANQNPDGTPATQPYTPIVVPK